MDKRKALGCMLEEMGFSVVSHGKWNSYEKNDVVVSLWPDSTMNVTRCELHVTVPYDEIGSVNVSCLHDGFSLVLRRGFSIYVDFEN